MKAVIFDMDGVIFDSERAVYALWCEMAEKYGFKNVDTPYYKSIGTNKDATRKIFLDFYGEDFAYDEYKKEQSVSYHKKYDGGRLPLKAGVFELLEYLKADGYFTAVASSTRSAVVQSQIEAAGLSKYFDRIIGGDMVEKSKPEPDIFLLAARELGLAAEECMVAEDSRNGVLAGYRAGMQVAMIPDLQSANEEIMPCVTHLLGSLAELPDRI